MNEHNCDWRELSDFIKVKNKNMQLKYNNKLYFLPIYNTIDYMSKIIHYSKYYIFFIKKPIHITFTIKRKIRD